MSLAQLSALTGIDKSHLSRVETGKAGLSDGNIVLLADAMGVTPDDITHKEIPVTAPRATKAEPRKRNAPTIRENIPAPSTPEGELFHYTPEEAALGLPFGAHKLRKMAFAREIPHVNNGNKIWFSGLNIRAISEQFTVQPFTKSTRTRSAA